MVSATPAETVFVPCPRCDGDGGKSFWPGGTCFRCDGRKGEWVAPAVVARRASARERSAAKRAAKSEERYAALLASRAETWAVWAAENPEYAARLLALPKTPAVAEVIRYAEDGETVYQSWEEMIGRLEGKTR